MAGLAAGVIVVGVAGLAWLNRNSGATTTVIAPGPHVEYRRVTHVDNDYSLEIPTDWSPAADNTGTTLSYAATPPSLGSVRVTVGFDSGPLSDHVATLERALVAQGGRNFRTTPTSIGGLAAIRLDYNFPESPTPGARLVAHSSFFVKRDSQSVISFQLTTAEPTVERAVFAHMQGSFDIPR